MPDIVDTVMSAGTFSTLVNAITIAGWDTALKSPGLFTVFAPSCNAFAKLPSGIVESLLEDVSTLRKILEYHVVAGKITASEVVKLDSTPTTEGGDLLISSFMTQPNSYLHQLNSNSLQWRKKRIVSSVGSVSVSDQPMQPQEIL
jgi:uncharacterized surface protein with fasciclin (FAS1) repeats